MTVCKTHDARRLHLVHRSRTLDVCLFTNKQCECNTRHFEEVRDNLAGYRLIRTDSLSTLWVICLSVQFGHHIKRYRISNVKCVGIWFVHVEYGRSVSLPRLLSFLDFQVIDLIQTNDYYSDWGLLARQTVSDERLWVYLWWRESESDIALRWVHIESSLIFKLRRVKDQRRIRFRLV